MKLLNLFLLITLCFTLIKALDLNNIPMDIAHLDLKIADLGTTNDPKISSCNYNQNERKIYCEFENSKYKDLYLTIPIYWNFELRPFDEIKEWKLIQCDSTKCIDDNIIAYSSVYEIIEAGDRYEPFYSNIFLFPEKDKYKCFYAFLTSGWGVYINYKEVFVNERKPK